MDIDASSSPRFPERTRQEQPPSRARPSLTRSLQRLLGHVRDGCSACADALLAIAPRWRKNYSAGGGLGDEGGRRLGVLERIDDIHAASVSPIGLRVESIIMIHFIEKTR